MWAQGSQWNQMPLDAASYQNVNHELVDWAALAQQWIRMKEVHESAVVNVPGMVHGHIGYAAPPKVHSMPVPDHVNHGVNGGEAPMDVEKDEEHASLPSEILWNQIKPQMKHQVPTCWALENPVCRGVPLQAGLLSSPRSHPAFVTQAGVLSSTLPRPAFVTPQVAQPSISIAPPVISTSHISVNPSEFPRPPLLLQSSRQCSSDEDSNGLPSSAGALDAAKRKNLPAWIREGLERMEREKLKREEREKFLQDRELHRKKQILAGSSHGNEASSRFDSSDESDQDGADSENDESSITRSPHPPPKQALSPEHVMLLIRQLMTETLLEVTTEEIRHAATDVCQLAKVKSQQVLHSVSSKSLTHKLGLDQYGSDSDEDGDGGASNGPTGNQEPIDTSTGKSEQGVDRKAASLGLLYSNRLPIEMKASCPSTVHTKVEMDNDSIGHNGTAEVGRVTEKEVCAGDSKIDGASITGFAEKDSQSRETSNGKEEKRVSSRSSSRDTRRRSRSAERHSRRFKERDRSKSSRRSRSRGRRSSSRDYRRNRSRDRKRSRTRRRSSSKERRNSSKTRSSRGRSRSSSRSRRRNYRQSRS